MVSFGELVGADSPCIGMKQFRRVLQLWFTFGNDCPRQDHARSTLGEMRNTRREIVCCTSGIVPRISAWSSFPDGFDVLVAVIVFTQVRLAAVDIVVPHDDLNAIGNLNILNDSAFDNDGHGFLHGSGPLVRF